MAQVKLILLSLLVTASSFGAGLGFTAARQGAAAAGGGGSISVVFTNAIAGTPGGMSAVSAGDTTAASSMLAILHWYSGAANISDDNGNAWTGLTEYTANAGSYQLRIYHCASFNGKADHKFSSTSAYSSISLIGVTGLNATPFDAESGFDSTGFATTRQPGSVTPSVDNCIVVTGSIISDNETLSVDSGFTVGQSTAVSAAIATSYAYKIQTSAAAVNPTWSKSSSTVLGAAMAVLKPQ